jgi:hypothetical protein
LGFFGSVFYCQPWMQVTTLVSSKSPQKKKGKSKRAHVLVAAVERATANFVEKGELIAAENPDIKLEMLTAVEEVRATGTAMSAAAKEFANDPCSSVKRGNMVRASRNLLSAVTRLLILADMIDVHLLLKKLRRVEDDLEYLKSVSSQAELMEGMDRFGKSSADLMTQAAKRQYELKDPVIDFSVFFNKYISSQFGSGSGSALVFKFGSGSASKLFRSTTLPLANIIWDLDRSKWWVYGFYLLYSMGACLLLPCNQLATVTNRKIKGFTEKYHN